MRILLTGGTGLIGSQVGIALAKSGHDITALSRKGNPRDLCFPARCLAWDHANPLPSAVLAPNGEAFDAVIHLAGEPVAQRWTRSVKERIKKSRVNSTKALIQSLKQLKVLPSVWLNASAIGIYGDNNHQIQTESAPHASGFLGDVCQEWEAALSELPATTRSVSLRFGIILSNEDGALPKMLAPFRYGVGGPIGQGRQMMSWIHIDDTTAAILHALKTQSVVGPVNVVAPHPVSNAEFTREISQTVGLPAVMPVPGFMLKILLGEMSNIILSSAAVAPEKLIQSGFIFQYPTLKPCLQNLLAVNERKGVRLYVARQWIKGTPAEHFPFFSAAENLETITPPWLHFRITAKSSETMTNGVLIDYKLRIKGLPVSWRTRIESWNPPHQFVDTQLKGPYKIWHHTHTFESLGEGTLMTDRVLYKMRFWPLGDVALPMVKHDVETIFRYRKSVIDRLLGHKSLKP